MPKRTLKHFDIEKLENTTIALNGAIGADLVVTTLCALGCTGTCGCSNPDSACGNGCTGTCGCTPNGACTGTCGCSPPGACTGTCGCTDNGACTGTCNCGISLVCCETLEAQGA